MVKVEFEGVDKAIETLNGMAHYYPKQTVAAGLRTAVKPFKDDVEDHAPFSGGYRLVKSKLWMPKNEEPLLGVGVFGKKGDAGKVRRKRKVPKSKKRSRFTSNDSMKMSMWYVWYWVDYGTLSNRSPLHRFSNSRKVWTQGWNGGIRATRSVDHSWARKDIQVIHGIPKACARASERYIKRMNKKGIAVIARPDP